MPRCMPFSVITPCSRTERSRPGTPSAVSAPALKNKEVLCINHASPDDTIPMLKARRQNDAPGKIIPRKTSRGTTGVFIIVRQAFRSGLLFQGGRSAAHRNTTSPDV